MPNIPRVLLISILNSAPPLNTPHRETRRIRKTTHNPRLPLKRTLHRLEHTRIAPSQIEDIDIPLRAPHNHDAIIPHVHRVHSLLALQCGRRPLLSEVPVLDCSVEGSGDETFTIVGKCY